MIFEKSKNRLLKNFLLEFLNRKELKSKKNETFILPTSRPHHTHNIKLMVNIESSDTILKDLTIKNQDWVVK